MKTAGLKDCATDKNQSSFFFSIRLCKIDVVMDSTILKSSAYQKLVTVKPSTNLSIIKIIIAFITNRKSPSVRIVTGRVNKIKIGFTIEFKNASTTATISAVTIFSVLTPGNT